VCIRDKKTVTNNLKGCKNMKKGRKIVALVTTVLMTAMLFSPMTFAKAAPESKATGSVSASSQKLVSTIQPDAAKQLEKKIPSVLEKVKSGNTKSPVPAVANDLLPLDPSGVETGEITVTGGEADYYTVAAQDSDYNVYLKFENPEDCALLVGVFDGSTGNLISESQSTISDNNYQRTRVRASAGNIVLFEIVHFGTDTPDIQYTMNVYNITSVTDQNEVNDNLFEAVDGASITSNTGINADFDNPYDDDIYKFSSSDESHYAKVVFSSPNGDVADIQTEVYQYTPNGTGGGTLTPITSGNGGVTYFTTLYQKDYIIEVHSIAQEDYNYTMNFQTIDNGYYDTYEANNTLQTAYSVGTWNYKSVQGTIFNKYSLSNPYSDDIDYYRFYATAGDKLALYLHQTTFDNMPLDMKLYNGSTYSQIGTGASGKVANTKIYRFNVPTTGYYIVSIAATPGDTLNEHTAFDAYTLEFDARIASGSITASFSPTSLRNPGASLSSLGTPGYAPVAQLDLRSNSSVPDGATITSLQINGTMSPSLGNTYMELEPSSNGVVYTSVRDSGIFSSITASLNLPVKQLFYMDYYTYATSASTYSNLRAAINYTYDQTLNW
jgi:hypothetical protein